MRPSRLTGESVAQDGGERRLARPGRGTLRGVSADHPRLGEPGATISRTDPDASRPNSGKGSDQLERWLRSDRPRTLGSLIELFEEKSFAILFVLLLGVPALPLPTGGATHVFEIISVLLALQLVAGRDEIWLPRRWRARELTGDKQRRFIAALMRMIRRLERFSRPRLRFLLDRRLSNIIFGVLVIGLCVGAFFAPPFSGLDTLPALGVVLLSLGMLLTDFVVVAVGLVVGVAGVVLELALGATALHALSTLF